MSNHSPEIPDPSRNVDYLATVVSAGYRDGEGTRVADLLDGEAQVYLKTLKDDEALSRFVTNSSIEFIPVGFDPEDEEILRQQALSDEDSRIKGPPKIRSGVLGGTIALSAGFNNDFHEDRREAMLADSTEIVSNSEFVHHALKRQRDTEDFVRSIGAFKYRQDGTFRNLVKIDNEISLLLPIADQNTASDAEALRKIGEFNFSEGIMVYDVFSRRLKKQRELLPIVSNVKGEEFTEVGSSGEVAAMEARAMIDEEYPPGIHPHVENMDVVATTGGEEPLF